MSTEIWDLAGTLGSGLGSSASPWAEVGDWALPIINSQSLRARIHPAFSFFGGRVRLTNMVPTFLCCW